MVQTILDNWEHRYEIKKVEWKKENVPARRNCTKSAILTRDEKNFRREDNVIHQVTVLDFTDTLIKFLKRLFVNL